MYWRYCAPKSARTRVTASSNPLWRSSLSALSVAYVILMRGLASVVIATVPQVGVGVAARASAGGAGMETSV